VYLLNDNQRFAAHRLSSRGLALACADSIDDGLVAEEWVPGVEVDPLVLGRLEERVTGPKDTRL